MTVGQGSRRRISQMSHCVTLLKPIKHARDREKLRDVGSKWRQVAATFLTFPSLYPPIFV